jgi:signal transduction histidine kinase
MTTKKAKPKAKRAPRAASPQRGVAVRSGAAVGRRTPLSDRQEVPLELHVQQLEERLAALRAIGAAHARCLGLDDVFREMVPQVSRVMRAARTTLFLFDQERSEIWSKVAEGADVREIRLALGHGIAGWVAKHKKPANIADAYADARFNPDIDVRTGFCTKSVAAVPVIDKQEKLVGVLQVLNHQDGPFSNDDLHLLESIALQTAYAVENAGLAERLLAQNRELVAARARAEHKSAELDLLYQLERKSAASSDLDELLASILDRACAHLRSEAGSVLLLEQQSGRLFFRATSGPRGEELKRVKLAAGKGVVGWVAEHGEPLIVNEPENDARHERTIADEINYRAKALLAVPLVWDGRTIGAVEVLNPVAKPDGRQGYDSDDLRLLTLIAGQVARAVTLAIEKRAHLDTARLAAVGNMLAGVAHDLRNPMTVISGYAQLMTEDGDQTRRRAASDRIQQQVDEMTGMIGDLLAFARGDSTLHPSVIELSRLANDIREAIGLQCEQHGLQLDLKHAEATVCIDSGRAKRIVYNLVRNAIDVLPRGGRLSICLGHDQGDCTVEVADNGPGLPDEMAQRLFQPFATVGKAHGTGLGLSIVKRFVDDHHGHIQVTTAPGAGTTFSVRLHDAMEVTAPRGAA